MSMFNIISTIAFATAVGVAVWDIEDPWKRLFLYLVFFVSVIGIRIAEDADGYERGVQNTVCIFNDIPGDCK